VGKTRLALQAAANLVTDFPDGVWLCELAAAVDAESMRQVVATALGYVPTPGADLERGITSFMGSRHLLVVMDNCEHLLDAVAALTETIVERCPSVSILATSREALEVRGEQVIRLRSLPVPRAGASLDELAAFDAARLFLDRAAATGADVTLEAADGPAIAEICRRLDGIPLAIELAAARAIALAPDEIAAHLDERFRLLTGGRRAAVERHHTLRATIDWSYSLLNARDQAVFNRLGVFPASFDASAAQAVAGPGGLEPWDVLDALTSLVAKSILNANRSTGGPTRYQMLESLRDYARERLDASGSADDARRCHARHYASAVVDISSGLRGPDETSWRRRFGPDGDNFRAAVAWGLDSAVEDDGELAMVILGELTYSWTVSWPGGGRTVLLAYAEQALERARSSPSRYASPVIAGAALNAFSRGDFRRGRELAREAVQLVRSSPHPHVVFALDFMFGDPKTLADRLSAALRILDETGADLWEYGQVHGSAAAMAATLGNLELARREAEVTLEIGRRLEHPSSLAIALYAFGLASWQSDQTAAQAALEEYIQIVHTTGYYDFAVPKALALQAQLLARDGELLAALAALREGLESAHINGDRPSMATCLARGAAVMVALGELDTATVFFGIVIDGVLARLNALPPNELPEYDAFVTTVRSQLADHRWAAAMGRGATMTFEQVSAFALAAVKDLCSSAGTSS
jgi:predicted ATPase